jgi:hypothetical protein
MDEEISIINTKTRNEKIKNFFIENKKNFNIYTFIFNIIIVKLLFLSNIQKKKEKFQII